MAILWFRGARLECGGGMRDLYMLIVSKKFTWVIFAPKHTFLAPWRETYQKEVIFEPP